MPVVINSAADIAAFANPIFAAALRVARDNNLMSNVVSTFNDLSGDNARKFQTYGTATMNTVAETDDIASQQFVPSATATLTPSEVGGQFFMTDRRIDTDPFNVRAEAATELGMAMASKIERDLISDFPSLTGGTVGAAGTVFTWGHFQAAIARLRAKNAPGPWAAVIHPYHWNRLAAAVTPATALQTNSPNFQDRVMMDYFVGRVMGVDIFTSTNVPVDSSDDAIGALFSRQALGLDMRRAPRLEPERDASRRGWELNMTSVYAHGVIRADYGIQLVFDASTPSS